MLIGSPHSQADKVELAKQRRPKSRSTTFGRMFNMRIIFSNTSFSRDMWTQIITAPHIPDFMSNSIAQDLGAFGRTFWWVKHIVLDQAQLASLGRLWEYRVALLIGMNYGSCTRVNKQAKYYPCFMKTAPICLVKNQRSVYLTNSIGKKSKHLHYLPNGLYMRIKSMVNLLMLIWQCRCSYLYLHYWSNLQEGWLLAKEYMTCVLWNGRSIE
jgi:hypothetical protein